MWVGKTRELFFNNVMPKFNLKNTPFYILTRSFEHKFVRETKEFETVSVKIRVASYNRKFATLEHDVSGSGVPLLWIEASSVIDGHFLVPVQGLTNSISYETLPPYATYNTRAGSR
jgi:acyl-CoA thioesterase FadM